VPCRAVSNTHAHTHVTIHRHGHTRGQARCAVRAQPTDLQLTQHQSSRRAPNGYRPAPPLPRDTPGTFVCQTARAPKTQDIFSLGCVIAEVFCDGKMLFELSDLLAYR
jgi:hypothetical protein